MTLGLRGKIFLFAVGLSTAVLVPGGLYLSRELRSTIEERIERELVTDLHAARLLFERDGRRDPATDVTGDDLILTGKIALAHLNEFPDYYIRLARMEEEARVFWQGEAHVASPANPLPS